MDQVVKYLSFTRFAPVFRPPLFETSFPLAPVSGPVRNKSWQSPDCRESETRNTIHTGLKTGANKEQRTAVLAFLKRRLAKEAEHDAAKSK